MNSNEIKITVSGLAGTGKSGIAHAIQTYLENVCGLEVAYEDPDAVNTIERSEKVIESMINRGTKITIIHEQGRRNV